MSLSALDIVGRLGARIAARRGMALVFALAALLLAGPAHAETLICTANSFVSWQAGEAVADLADTDPAYLRSFTFDMATGDFHMLPSEVVEESRSSYEIVRAGNPDLNIESDLVAFDRQSASLLRIRLTFAEYQFVHDHGRTLDVGTCGIVREGADG